MTPDLLVSRLSIDRTKWNALYDNFGKMVPLVRILALLAIVAMSGSAVAHGLAAGADQDRAWRITSAAATPTTSQEASRMSDVRGSALHKVGVSHDVVACSSVHVANSDPCGGCAACSICCIPAGLIGPSSAGIVDTAPFISFLPFHAAVAHFTRDVVERPPRPL